MHTPTHNYDCDYDCVVVFSRGAFQLLVIPSHVKQWLYLLLSLLIWPAPISGCPAKIMEQNLTCTHPWVQVKICSILFAGHNLVLSFILTFKISLYSDTGFVLTECWFPLYGLLKATSACLVCWDVPGEEGCDVTYVTGLRVCMKAYIHTGLYSIEADYLRSS